MELIRTENVNRTERPNSFEFGKAGQRHKIYYEGLTDMKLMIDNAVEGQKYFEERLVEVQEPEGTEKINGVEK